MLIRTLFDEKVVLNVVVPFVRFSLPVAGTILLIAVEVVVTELFGVVNTSYILVSCPY